MRLFLAVAVLMLAFVAYTEAQEETFTERLSKWSDKLAEIGRRVAAEANSAYESVRDSEPVVKSRSWVNEQVQRLQEKLNQ